MVKLKTGPLQQQKTANREKGEKRQKQIELKRGHLVKGQAAYSSTSLVLEDITKLYDSSIEKSVLRLIILGYLEKFNCY